MTVRDWLRWGTSILQEAKVPAAKHDAQAIMAFLMGTDRMSLVMKGDESLQDTMGSDYVQRIQRRAQGEPLQYILGEAPFYGYMFQVTPDVLIPRFDTEAVAEKALNMIGTKEMYVMDLGCGSGILGIVIKLERPGTCVTLTDISSAALDCAKGNAARLGAQVRLKCGDLFDAVPGEQFDLIISNPPYIPIPMKQTLDREVKWEPDLALFGGEDGMECYRRILSTLGQALRPGGALCLECSEEQAGPLLAQVKDRFDFSGDITDLAGHLRGVWGEGYHH